MTTVDANRRYALIRTCAKCGAAVQRQSMTSRTDSYMTTGRTEVVVVSTENLPCGHVWLGDDPSAATAVRPRT